MFPEGGLHRAPTADVRAAASKLELDGWTTFVLPDGIDATGRFFDAVQSVLPLDPPLQRISDSWDALDDSLWGGLDDLPSDRIAILWPDPLRFSERDPEGYEIALSILSDLPRSLADPEATAGDPTQLTVIVGT